MYSIDWAEFILLICDQFCKIEQHLNKSCKVVLGQVFEKYTFESSKAEAHLAQIDSNRNTIFFFGHGVTDMCCDPARFNSRKNMLGKI
jgi:hypothetical protein